jgi:hypothetical protein
MAILGRHARVVRAMPFFRAAEHATRGVVRVAGQHREQAHSMAWSTGWLVTEQLVLVPSYAVVDATDLVVESFRDADTEGERANGHVVFIDGQLALIALDRPMGVALELNLELCAPEADVWLLHHPLGASLALSWGRVQNIAGAELHHDADTEPGTGGAPILDLVVAR